MDFLYKLTKSNFVRGLIFFKVLAVVVLLVSLKGKITFGDKSLFGADTPAAKTPSKEQREAKEKEQADLLAATPDTEGFVDGDKKKPRRRSFLDELFELPKLDTETAKKDEIGKYLTIVERKTSQVEQRLEMLKEREKKLVEIEHVIDDKLRRLEEERRFFTDSLQQERDVKNERTASLVEFYQKMDAKKAAPVFEKLNKDLVVELFKAFPQKQVTLILQLLPPEKAVELSEYYGRLRSGKEYDVLKELNQSLKDEFQDCKGMPAPPATPPAVTAN